MERLYKLKAVIEEIESAGDPDELTQAAEYLESFHTKIKIRAMSLPEQRITLMVASASGDRRTLRTFEHSQHDEIRQWARDAQAPRGSAIPQFAV
jgi:hypothetical protein